MYFIHLFIATKSSCIFTVFTVNANWDSIWFLLENSDIKSDLTAYFCVIYHGTKYI